MVDSQARDEEVAMSGLAALLAGHNPPDLYRWHSATHVEDVQHAVEHAGWTFAYVDGWTVEDAASFRKTVAHALGLSDDATASDDALFAALDAFDPASHGVVMLWDGWSPLARHDATSFDAAVELLRRRVEAGAFAAVLRGEGPDLDLPELPIKHD
jgi:hypothetical protein